MEVCVEAHPLVLFWVYGYLPLSSSRDSETCPAGQRECWQLCFHTVIGVKLRRPAKIEQQECVVLSLFDTNDCDCSTAALRATNHKLRQMRKRDDFVTRPPIPFMASWGGLHKYLALSAVPHVLEVVQVGLPNISKRVEGGLVVRQVHRAALLPAQPLQGPRLRRNGVRGHRNHTTLICSKQGPFDIPQTPQTVLSGVSR